MLFPKLFNHGNLRSVKVEEGKVTFEGVYGKETFEDGSGDVHGIPSGGTSGQVLSKSSATDYDAGWSDVNQVPSDGTQNQVLTKGADGYGWSDINAVPSDGTQGQVLTKGASGYGWGNPASGIPEIGLRIECSDEYYDISPITTSEVGSATKTGDWSVLAVNNSQIILNVDVVFSDQDHVVSHQMSFKTLIYGNQSGHVRVSNLVALSGTEDYLEEPVWLFFGMMAIRNNTNPLNGINLYYTTIYP